MKKIFNFLKLQKSLIALLGIIFTFIPTIAFATVNYEVPDNAGNVIVDNTEKYDNFYSVGGTININNKINGDLIVAGNQININENINKSIIAAASNINLKENVGQNARLFAANTIIEGKILGDLIVAGGTITITDTAEIDGDLIVATGTANISGKINGNANIKADKVLLGGNFEKNVKTTCKELTLAQTAILNQDLDYYAPRELVQEQGSKVIGETTYNQTVDDSNWQNVFAKVALISKFFALIASIITGLILVYLLPKKSLEIVKYSGNNFWKALGIGFLSLFVPLIISMILFLTFIGAWVAAIIALLWVIALIFASLYGSIILGSIITKLINKQKEYQISWKEVLIGAILMSIISFIPGIGSLFTFVFMLIALGSVTSMMSRIIKAER